MLRCENWRQNLNSRHSNSLPSCSTTSAPIEPQASPSGTSDHGDMSEEERKECMLVYIESCAYTLSRDDLMSLSLIPLH